jgi:hypothetical protein
MRALMLDSAMADVWGDRRLRLGMSDRTAAEVRVEAARSNDSERRDTTTHRAPYEAAGNQGRQPDVIPPNHHRGAPYETPVDPHSAAQP